MEASSPPRKICCLWCSPKKVPNKRSKENEISGFEDGSWGKNDEILSDLSTFSQREQERRLKKALKEEEKISQEAEKVAKWVKQASARMDVSAIEDSLSNDKEIK